MSNPQQGQQLKRPTLAWRKKGDSQVLMSKMTGPEKTIAQATVRLQGNSDMTTKS